MHAFEISTANSSDALAAETRLGSQSVRLAGRRDAARRALTILSAQYVLRAVAGSFGVRSIAIRRVLSSESGASVGPHGTNAHHLSALQIVGPTAPDEVSTAAGSPSLLPLVRVAQTPLTVR